MPFASRSLEQSPRMTRGEKIFGWVYLPFYLLLTPCSSSCFCGGGGSSTTSTAST